MPFRFRTLALTVALAVAPLAITPEAVRAQESGIAVGAQAPTVVLESLDGAAVDLAQFIGRKPVVLEFWASWCGNCKQLEPRIDAAHKKYGQQVEFIGVAVSVNQTADRVKRYAERYKLPMRMLYDRKGLASDAYDVPATSYIVVIDRTGKVVYTGAGGTQDIDAAVRKAM